MRAGPRHFDDEQLERMRWVSSMWVALLLASAAAGWWENPLPAPRRAAVSMAGADCGGSFQALQAPPR